MSSWIDLRLLDVEENFVKNIDFPSKYLLFLSRAMAKLTFRHCFGNNDGASRLKPVFSG